MKDAPCDWSKPSQSVQPALILVDGALCYRLFGPMTELARLLASNFTVTTYDRCGRGESGNSMPYVLAKAIPHAQQRTLEGQPYDVDLKVLSPILVEFFTQ